MTPRAIWSGSILFGLVSLPVRMYSAIEEKDLHFHLLHTTDDSRIGYAKICKREQREVPDEEIGTAYEVAKGRFVYLTDEDFQAAAPRAYKTFDVAEFVDVSEIDPIYFERSYYLGPAEGGEKVYGLFVRAMEAAGLAAIGTYVMRNKQHLGCIRLRHRVLVLSKLYFADEVRDPEGIAPTGVRVSEEEMTMASELIERFTGRFDPAEYEDTYRKALLAIVKAKQRGEVTSVPEEAEEEPLDLLEALRQSVAAHATRGRRTGNGRRGGSANGRQSSLSGLTKPELARRARKRRVPGYSRMTKSELVDALT